MIEAQIYLLNTSKPLIVFKAEQLIEMTEKKTQFGQIEYLNGRSCNCG